MKAVIRPSAPAGSVEAPPSKSMAHRLLICAGLAAGESRVWPVAPSEDLLATADCLNALGADCRMEGGGAVLRGADPFALSEGAVLPCRESGSTLRFLLPVCLLSGRHVRLTGSGYLLRRPLSVYEDICASRSLSLDRSPAGLTVQGPLPPGVFRIPGDVSSQFTSGLLFSLPLLDADSRLCLLPPVESRPYIDMTLSALSAFGVEVEREDENTFRIPGGQRFRRREARVEGDWSNAAFFLALGVPVTGLDAASLQGDRVCAGAFAALDAGRAEFDISACPDLGPVLMAYAAQRRGCVLTGTKRLRLKESDRGAAMAAELGKFGVPVAVEQDRITVGCGARPPAEALDGHNDHRVVMALSVLCVGTGGVIAGAEAVSKSFPDFFDRLRALGVDVALSP